MLCSSSSSDSVTSAAQFLKGEKSPEMEDDWGPSCHLFNWKAPEVVMWRKMIEMIEMRRVSMK